MSREKTDEVILILQQLANTLSFVEDLQKKIDYDEKIETDKYLPRHLDYHDDRDFLVIEAIREGLTTVIKSLTYAPSYQRKLIQWLTFPLAKLANN